MSVFTPLGPVDEPRHRASAPAGTRPPRAADQGVRRAAGRSLVRRLANAAVSLVLVVCALAFLFLAVGPHVLGYRTSTMLTGSMAPGIVPGDVVVTVPRPASEVAVGDVISYHIPVEDHRVETHRVTEVTHAADGTTTIRTQGDANPGVDPWTATLDGDTVWELKAVVPQVGTAIRWLRTPVVRHGLLWGALGGMILVGLSLIWSPARDETDDEPGDEPDDGQDDGAVAR